MGVPRNFMVAVAAAVLVAAAPLAGGQQTPTFRTAAKIVPLYVTVTDQTGRLVPNLTKADFEIFDSGKPQEIALFSDEILPITVVVMLDTSGSMTGNLDFVNQGAEQFLLKMLPDDKACVGAFNDKIQFASPFSSNRDDQIAALKDLDFGNPTRLWDAVDASLNRLQGIEGRRVILVFTDGDDTASKTSLNAVLKRSIIEEVMIYAIGLRSNFFNGQMFVHTRPSGSLKNLAAETGGGYFELERAAELPATFTRVSEELHSQYLMGFAPAVLDGKVHKLEVRLKQPNMRARARKSYLAASELPAPEQKKK